MYCENGRFDEARRVLDDEVAAEFARCQDDPYPLNTVVMWSHAVGDLDHVRAAELLLPYLLPHTDEIGTASVIASGAAATAVGQLQSVLGQMPAANEAFARGVEVCTRLRSPFLLALTHCAWARSLLRSDEPGDRTRAFLNIDAAGELARRHGLVGIARRVESLR
jgi:hypothetical protein